MNSLIAADSPHHLDLITLTQRHLTRVYPRGIRQDSSNLNPLFYWTYGKKENIAFVFSSDINEKEKRSHSISFRNSNGCA